MRHHQSLFGASRRAAGAIAKTLVLALFVIAGSLIHIPKAEAARCSVNSTDAACTYKARDNWYWCGAIYYPRHVRWQIPEGTPPAGGWDIAFYYNGTTPNGHNPFSGSTADPYGQYYAPQVFREMLDNQAGTGRKYAVFAPEPPSSTTIRQFWHTNSVYPYSASCDNSFFKDFFDEIKGGKYGSASQFNLNRRFAFGISSGGYNASRMAVTFNDSSVWKALGIVAASYATCSGPLCSIPTLPSNHPPTKFWHGTADGTVPISTMRLYYDKLIAQGKTAQKVEHSGDHEFTVNELGQTGIKKWFDVH